MNIIVLGGAGDVGSRAAEELVGVDSVERVTVADLDLERAGAIARRLDTARCEVRAARVDANDHASLVAAIKGHDIAASAIGPFFRYEAPIVAAALEAGVDYTSVCDEWDAADAVFERFADQAREAGRFVLTGLGTSPGFTNVGVQYLAQDMDAVQRIEVAVYQPLDAGGGEAVVRHMLHIMNGDVATWRQGRRQMVPALSGSRLVEFPRFGKIRVWTMGHAEPVTLPRVIPEVQDVSFSMGYGRGSSWVVWPARLGLFSRPRLTGLFAKGLLAFEQRTVRTPSEGAVRLDVWGRQDGRDVHRMACGVGEMREATGVSLAVGALMVGRRQLSTDQPGVYAPEGCLEPGRFIDEMGRRGLQAYEDLAMTRPVGSTPA